MMDTNSILFESDRNIIGVSQIDDSTILITDEIRVLKYEVRRCEISCLIYFEDYSVIVLHHR